MNIVTINKISSKLRKCGVSKTRTKHSQTVIFYKNSGFLRKPGVARKIDDFKCLFCKGYAQSFGMFIRVSSNGG